MAGAGVAVLGRCGPVVADDEHANRRSQGRGAPTPVNPGAELVAGHTFALANLVQGIPQRGLEP